MPKIPELNSAIRAGDCMRYVVFIDDNFHYMDAGERVTHGTFATAQEAVAACRLNVDAELDSYQRQGFQSIQLYCGVAAALIP